MRELFFIGAACGLMLTGIMQATLLRTSSDIVSGLLKACLSVLLLILYANAVLP